MTQFLGFQGICAARTGTSAAMFWRWSAGHSQREPLSCGSLEALAIRVHPITHADHEQQF